MGKPPESSTPRFTPAITRSSWSLRPITAARRWPMPLQGARARRSWCASGSGTRATMERSSQSTGPELRIGMAETASNETIKQAARRGWPESSRATPSGSRPGRARARPRAKLAGDAQLERRAPAREGLSPAAAAFKRSSCSTRGRLPRHWPWRREPSSPAAAVAPRSLASLLSLAWPTALLVFARAAPSCLAGRGSLTAPAEVAGTSGARQGSITRRHFRRDRAMREPDEQQQEQEQQRRLRTALGPCRSVGSGSWR